MDITRSPGGLLSSAAKTSWRCIPTGPTISAAARGGGAWAAPYVEERIFYGRVKAKQIKDTGAKLLIAPCHNCRDQIMKSLRKEYDFMDVEVKYLWELVADSLIIEPREVEPEEE